MPFPPHALGRRFERLDRLLRREVLRLRARYQLSLDEFRGLYVSDEQVDSLIRQAAAEQGEPDPLDIPPPSDLAEGNGAAWRQLCEAFALTQDMEDVVALALAPEFDLKYETLFAYLNNDVTRKWPTIDLALRLLGDDVSAVDGEAARMLALRGPLFGSGLLEPITGPERRSGLAMGFAVSPAVTAFMQGLPADDSALNAVPLTVVPSSPQPSRAIPLRLGRFAPLWRGLPPYPVLVLTGRPGAGRAEALAGLCGTLGRGLVVAPFKPLLRAGDEAPALARRLVLRARLEHLGVCLRLDGSEGEAVASAPSGVETLLGQFAGAPVPVFLLASSDETARRVFGGLPIIIEPFTDPTAEERRRLWSESLDRAGVVADDEAVACVAERFVLNPGQIRQAALSLRLRRRTRNNRDAVTDRPALLAAARAQCLTDLGGLAARVPPLHAWHDLVLPEATLERVQTVATAIARRHTVYQDWGFARRTRAPNGLMVLFAGASGTGKTMTASVIADHLGLDLYRIDLATVVSKYIGETEKNLDRIFAAAERANAVLFFDEADALFGKRSEVKDAHDRYANIEVAYLLQKMEEHDGVVILASNLSRNIDQAFARRMHYVIDFPRPDEALRERLWRGVFSSATPLADDVDLAFVARQFVLTGGDIRTAALDAAFTAAGEGGTLTMSAILRAVARHLLKQGKVPAASDFRQYYPLVAT